MSTESKEALEAAIKELSQKNEERLQSLQSARDELRAEQEKFAKTQDVLKSLKSKTSSFLNVFLQSVGNIIDNKEETEDDLKPRQSVGQIIDDKEVIVYGLNKYDVDRVVNMVESADMVIKKIEDVSVSDKKNTIELNLDNVTSSYNALADEIGKNNVITIFQRDEIEGFKEFLKAKADWTGEVHVRKKNKKVKNALKEVLKQLVKDRDIRIK